MIFVTVGTHEQSFDRLIRKIDDLKGKNIINEKVIIQLGYTKYKPQFCEWMEMIGFDEMHNYVKQANIVITHGGPGSIFLPLQYKKIPIVVPRQKEYGEHVDNHQVLFTKRLEKMKKVLPVYNIEDLENKILNYNNLVKTREAFYISNTDKFVESLEKEVLDLIK
ncbi:PssE/Cps14G family polysaccharide biosynthesis glycosyltransferase [Geobacillus stearothermophilus]|uniref:PssE/Cps14G family polysaccharide biosynthesis glycosyltransferase n=1 Tax=Geobacillus stearothermophilus TaxID=1422 RepID=UPI003D233E4E